MGDPATFELPDIEYVLIQWLKLQSLSASTIGSQLPVGYDGTQSVVALDRLGGGIDNSLPYFLDRARVDVSCYGRDKSTAWDLTSKVRRLVLRSYMDGNFRPWNARIVDVKELVGPQWLTESEYGAAGRYLMQFEVSLHAVGI
jgi:hypothetical protein